jgi:hypothetical protein
LSRGPRVDSLVPQLDSQVHDALARLLVIGGHEQGEGSAADRSAAHRLREDRVEGLHHPRTGKQVRDLLGRRRREADGERQVVGRHRVADVDDDAPVQRLPHARGEDVRDHVEGHGQDHQLPVLRRFVDRPDFQTRAGLGQTVKPCRIP